MDNFIINIIIITLFVVISIFTSIMLRKFSYIAQSIIAIIIFLLAVVLNKILLGRYKHYFENQWHYSNDYSWKYGYGENIVTPFLFIGAIIILLFSY